MKVTRTSQIQKGILCILATSGILMTAIVAPNLFKGLSDLGFIKTKKYGKRTISKLLNNLITKKFIYQHKDKKLSVTQKGASKIKELELQNLKIKTIKTWDKKWRIIIFDIPERLKKIRESLRILLQENSFIKLQDSVWIYPYDCEEYIELVKTDLNIRKYVLYIVAESLENDHVIKKHFNLDNF